MSKEFNRKIDFPYYFDGNTKFNSLGFQQQVFVNYIHELDYIRDIQLSIHSSFFLFVLEGQVNLIGLNGEHKVGSNEAVVIKKGAYIMSEDLSEPNNEFKAFLFFISDEMLFDFSFSVNSSVVEKPVEKSSLQVCKVSVSTNLQLYVHSVINLVSSSKTNDVEDNLVKIKALELLHYLFQNKEANKIAEVLLSELTDEEISISQVLENNYKENLSIAEIAFLCKMSASNFKRKFKSFYETTPARWIKERRLEEAHKILSRNLNKEYSIYELSYELGFNSASHFIKSFKEKYGTSPGRHIG